MMCRWADLGLMNLGTAGDGSPFSPLRAVVVPAEPLLTHQKHDSNMDLLISFVSISLPNRSAFLFCVVFSSASSARSRCSSSIIARFSRRKASMSENSESARKTISFLAFSFRPSSCALRSLSSAVY